MRTFRNYQYLLAQIGPKAARRESLSMLLEPLQLPGNGWTLLDQRSWRTGYTSKPSEAGRRARRARTFSAVRSFELAAESRWVWIEVMPFAVAADAEAVLSSLPTLFVGNPRAKVTVTGERRLDHAEISEIADYPFVYEQLTSGERGPSASRYAAGTVEHVVFIVATSEYGEGWPWAEVASVAASQVASIRNVMDDSPNVETG
jgi:hypothetical protein